MQFLPLSNHPCVYSERQLADGIWLGKGHFSVQFQENVCIDSLTQRMLVSQVKAQIPHVAM